MSGSRPTSAPPPDDGCYPDSYYHETGLPGDEDQADDLECAPGRPCSLCQSVKFADDEL